MWMMFLFGVVVGGICYLAYYHFSSTTVKAYVMFMEDKNTVKLQYVYNGEKYQFKMPRTCKNSDLVYGETVMLQLRIARNIGYRL